MASESAPSAGIFRVLVVASLLLLGASYYTPMWWVSLKAPNYPEHTFPDGVRIHMHWYGVQNGCKVRESDEVDEEEPLDCVHEMDTINHYIGMHPIARGAQLEFAAAPYLFAAFAVFLVVLLFYTGPVWWLLAVPVIVAPVVFLADFAAWLWWFGHNLHDWAAFTVKPFMPTMLGEGKVAQFNTYAYPAIGFAFSLAAAVTALLAVLVRRKQLQSAPPE